MNTDQDISINVEAVNLAAFGFILQQGFEVPVQPGCSLKKILTDQFNIKNEYIDKRIKTAFLDGKPVDDYDSAIVENRATLALSAAMPGLVGATFRSGGILSPFRSGISFKNKEKTRDQQSHGQITVKLFNLLVKELGPTFLEQGIIVAAGSIIDLFTTFVSGRDNFFKKIRINNLVSDPQQLIEALTPAGSTAVNLRVRLVQL